ncbi:hypothetical protein V8D89_016090 [Ganoderma adspersum]
MEGDINDLLHLGDLVSIEDTSTALSVTAQSTLAEDDIPLFRDIPLTNMQEWCMGRIAEHRAHIRRLREASGPAVRDSISETKSHIRALRSQYNASAPINYYLPPEVLMEVFAGVHPAMTSRPHIPVLRVCRYWRTLLFKTPQFWANLLSLPTLYSRNPIWRRSRFKAALELSAPRDLTLSLSFWALDIDIPLPHASRIASLSLRLQSDLESTQQLLEQRLTGLTNLVIFEAWTSWLQPLTLYFHQYPNIRSLRLDVALFYSSVVPCTSILHLKLTRCMIRPLDAGSSIRPLRALHDALRLFPNLETLSLTYSLWEGSFNREPPELTKTVYLPRLCRVEIEDVPSYIPQLLSHLAFPSTTALILYPAYRYPSERHQAVAAPVFPNMGPSPPPADAEIGLHLDFWTSLTPNHYHQGIARWETHGEGVRPVCVTLAGAERALEPVAHFNRELVRTLAPAPARGLTALTASGIRTQTGDSRACEYWTAFLPDLPGLRRLVCTKGGVTRDFLEVLGRPLPESGEFPCPCLEQVELVWNLPDTNIRVLEFDMEEEDCDGGTSRYHDVGCPSLGSREVVTAVGTLCDTARECLAARAGHCGSIRKLSVALFGANGGRVDLWEWEVALVERQLRDRLGWLVGDVAFVDRVHYQPCAQRRWINLN